MGACIERVRVLAAQLPWEPLAVEVAVAEGGTHGDHRLGASRGREQVEEAACTVLAVPLSPGGWGLVGSCSVAYDGTREDCAVVVEVGVEADALTCIVVILSTSWSNCLVFWRSVCQ